MKCLTDESIFLRMLPKRRANANKGTYGRLLLIAGSEGMSGAAYLAALAAYRSGAGLVKILTHASNRVILQMQLPEAILETYTEETALSAQLHKALAWADACVIGPGLGQSVLSAQLLAAALEAVPDIVAQGKQDFFALLDADALNLCAAYKALHQRFDRAASACSVIVTPHPLEMSRISGMPPEEILAEPERCALQYGRLHGCTVVLKGAQTVVAAQGLVFRQLRMCPALAKAGSGDVLSGCIAGMYLLLLAEARQKVTCEKKAAQVCEEAAEGQTTACAAALGVIVHNLAGGFAAKKTSAHAVLASETANEIGKVLMQYETV